MSLSMKKALLDCGCGCFSTSESISDSQSASDTGPPTVTRTCVPDDHRCVDDTGPAVFKITATAQAGAQAVCFPLYQGPFFLYVGPNPSVCFAYYSSELPISIPSPPGCTERTGTGFSRWQAAFSVSGSNVLLSCTAYYWDSNLSSTFSRIQYSSIVGTISMNCVGSFTLARSGPAPTNYPFAPTLSIEAV